MDKGMKIGTLIAMGLVVVVGIVFLLRLREPPDEPTSKTAPDKLKKVDLPAGTSSLIFRSSQVSADDPSSRWGFWLRITDDKYEPIKDLRIGPLQ